MGFRDNVKSYARSLHGAVFWHLHDDLVSLHMIHIEKNRDLGEEAMNGDKHKTRENKLEPQPDPAIPSTTGEGRGEWQRLYITEINGKGRMEKSAQEPPVKKEPS